MVFTAYFGVTAQHWQTILAMTAMKEKPSLLLMLGGSGAGKGTFLRAGALGAFVDRC